METIVIEENGVAAAFELHAFGTAASGPRLFFTAGIHGNEVTGVYVARMLIDHLEAQPLLRGEVRVIPAVNAAAMRCMQRCNPFDGEDLNRIFPGDAAGSISHRLAAAVWERTASADALVDLHCCGQHGLPYILALHGESPAARELARRIPLPRCVQSYGSAGQLFVESARRRGQASCIIDYARDYVNNGIPGNPAFDEMMEKYMFRCADSGLYYSETKKLPCIKGAALYEADEKTYLVLPEYYRSPETRGYISACASFANVGFSSRALIIAT